MKPWMYALIAVLAVLVVLAVVLIVLKVVKNKRIRESERKADQKIEESASHLSLLFGGKENIKQISSRGSRVSLEVLDTSKIEKEAITKELDSVMFMGNKIVFIIGSKSEEFERLLNENIDKQSK